MEKSLDRKLAAIHADPGGCREFIIADAKDADLAFGMGAPVLSPERHGMHPRFKTLAQYRQQIRDVVQQGLVDIMLMSASTNELLTIEERLFDKSLITPAARANDTTDIHIARGGTLHQSAALPFRTASVDHIQCGHLDCEPAERALGADLGLYSTTFNNDTALDHHTIREFKKFREEAERKGFRYFWDIFDPNVPNAVAPDKLPGFINDLIARTLAGVAQAGRPVFLKMVYHGPAAHVQPLDRHARGGAVRGRVDGGGGMNRLMKSIVLDAVFAGLLIAGLYYGVDGAMNVISGVIVIAFLLSLSLFAESAKAQLNALGQPALPHWFSAVFDMLVVVAVWWHGYFMLGAMWAFTAALTITTWRKALKDEPAEGA